MNGDRVGIAMSGGVDSTVAATLLQEQGYEVHGFFMELPLPDRERQVERVRTTADRLAIPLEIVDMRRRFSESIINSFVAAYTHGDTPNPCVVCNAAIKFGALLTCMLEHGMEKMATGHYARIEKNEKGTYSLFRAMDPQKDQSYFLCRLDQKQLSRIILPLASWRKSDVLARATALGLGDYGGSESQDVCFLTTGLKQFLAEHGVEEKSGDIITGDGRILGRHSGISHFTVGQRRGLGLPDATPWYVIGLDRQHNRIIIGKNEELFQKHVIIRELHWLDGEPALPWQGLVQLRSRHLPGAARLEQKNRDTWQITFSEPQRAITPGQFAVFYEEERVAGSGIIVTPGAVSDQL